VSVLSTAERTRRADALTRIAPWVAAIAVALPVLAYRYPPMFDLPCHEEIVSAMRHFGDANRYPPGLLEWNVGHANQLFYFLAWPLSYVVPVDLACKLVVAASLAWTPLAAARLADYVGVTRAAAVVVAPVSLGFAFMFGFVGNVLGLAMFLAFLPLFDRLARAPTVKGAAGAFAALVALYFAHEIALAFGWIAIVTLSIAQPLRLRATALRLAPIVALVPGLVVEHASTIAHRGPNLTGLPTVIDLAPWQKLAQIPESVLGRHGDATTLPAFVLLMGTLFLLGLDRFRSRSVEPSVARGLRAQIDARRFELLGVVFVAAYFVVPFSVTGAMWLHARFLAPGVAVLAIAIAPRTGSSPWLVTRNAPFLVILAMFALLRPELRATSDLYRDLDPLLARIAPGSAVAHVDMVGGPLRNLVFSVGGASARAASEHGGRMAVSFTQTSPIPAVVMTRAHRWDGALLRISRDGVGLRPAFDLHRFRYVLAWTYPTQSEPLVRAMAPEARLVAKSGGWLLFESTLSLVPITSDEPPVGNEETVGDRLRAAARPPP
jgi:hypothetical protein